MIQCSICKEKSHPTCDCPFKKKNAPSGPNPDLEQEFRKFMYMMKGDDPNSYSTSSSSGGFALENSGPTLAIGYEKDNTQPPQPTSQTNISNGNNNSVINPLSAISPLFSDPNQYINNEHTQYEDAVNNVLGKYKLSREAVQEAEVPLMQNSGKLLFSNLIEPILAITNTESQHVPLHTSFKGSETGITNVENVQLVDTNGIAMGEALPQGAVSNPVANPLVGALYAPYVVHYNNMIINPHQYYYNLPSILNS